MLKRTSKFSCYLTQANTKRTLLAVGVFLLVLGFMYVRCSKGTGRVILLRSALRPGATAKAHDFNSSAAAVWKTVPMRVTAYCPCSRCCGRYADGITACGHKIQSGDAFAAAGAQYSFGTEMITPGYNNGEPVKVLDRGAAISGDRLDVFFDSHQQALDWGVRYLQVKVLSK